MTAVHTLCALLVVQASSVGPGPEARLGGQWRFDEDAGLVVKDSSGAGLDGKIGNSDQVLRVKGRHGMGLEFSDAEKNKLGCVLVTGMRTVDLSKGFTIEAWIRFNDRHVRQDTCYIASDGPWRGPGWRFIIPYNTLFLQSGDGEDMWGVGSDAAQHGGMENGRWYHVAGTYDGSIYRIHLDGVEVGVSKPKLTLAKGTDTLCIGSYNGGADSVFNGTIDDVKLWVGARPHLDIVKDARLHSWAPRK